MDASSMSLHLNESKCSHYGCRYVHGASRLTLLLMLIAFPKAMAALSGMHDRGTYVLSARVHWYCVNAGNKPLLAAGCR